MNSIINNSELGQVPISDIKPSPENNNLYHSVSSDDPTIIELAKSIKEKGILEPIVISLDRYIISGHRRHTAAKLAGLDVIPCRIINVKRNDPDYITIIREYNRQRVKTMDEVIRETIVDVSKEDAHRELIRHRCDESKIDRVSTFCIDGKMNRASISKAKNEFLSAIIDVLNNLIDYWPLTDRQIHYNLLNNPPLKHMSKPDSVYKNDKESYRSLTELLTRARVFGYIPFHVIADETRPFTPGKGWRSADTFINDDMKNFLKYYRRDLMQSQPNHIEIIGEKNTVMKTIQKAANEFCIPVTSGRGFSSLAPRYEMAERFRKSGKQSLVVIIVSDFDPDGEEIAQSFARSMRDDFKIKSIQPIRAALTYEQVKTFNLKQGGEAKQGSTNYDKFVEKYGKTVYELEALHPKELHDIIIQIIESVINKDLFQKEIDKEKEDAAILSVYRQSALLYLNQLSVDDLKNI